MENYYFDCQCSAFNHIFRFVHDQKDNSVWVEVNLNHYLPWYKRVWEAFRFIFKMKSRHTHYDVTIMRPEDMVNLDRLLDNYVEYHSVMTREEALYLLEHAKSHPDYDNIVKGAWICNLQGTDEWVIDTISHSGQFVRCKNGIQITTG